MPTQKYHVEVDQKINNWTVLEINGSKITAQCSCGVIKIKPIYRIASGRDKGCKTCALERNKKWFPVIYRKGRE